MQPWDRQTHTIQESDADADFARLGSRVRGAFVLIETRELTDLDGLFREYADAHAIDTRAVAGAAAGVVVMASRPGDVLYRHMPSAGMDNTLTQIILERDAAERALRLLRAGRQLTLRAQVDAETGGPYESRNVIGEIPGSERHAKELHSRTRDEASTISGSGGFLARRTTWADSE